MDRSKTAKATLRALCLLGRYSSRRTPCHTPSGTRPWPSAADRGGNGSLASCMFGAASRGDDLPSPLVALGAGTLLGAGSEGPELVAAYRRFGSRVSIVDQGRQAHRRAGIGRAGEAWLAESRTTR